METKFCRTCGQANLPNEQICVKCGLNLGQSVDRNQTQNPFADNEDPYKTIAVGQQEPFKTSSNSAQPEKDSKGSNGKFLWILGGIGAFVFIGGFLIVALAAGIYFYSNNKTEIVKESNTTSEEKSDEKTKSEEKEDKSDPVLVKMTDQNIYQHINEKLKILGVYRLGKAGTPKKKTFAGSNAEQYGLYFPKNDRKEFVIFSMATFTSTQKAKEYVAEKATTVKNSGGEIISHSNKSKGDILLFNEKGNGGQIIDCNEGVCINILGTTGKHTSGFYKAYINRP